MPTDIGVRRPDKADVRAVAATLGRAFYDDPVMTWMLPNAARRAKGLPRMFAAMTRHHFLAGGGAEVAHRSEQIGAAALWDPPGAWKHSRREELRMLPGIMLAMGGRARRSMQVTELMKQHHPEEPHWYLAVIGSDPSVRGGGFGQALMHSRLDRVDAEHAPAYLESSNPDNIPYYNRFGFELSGEIKLPEGGPSLYPMWRAAR
ncbi:GNAT family N-acetyltransferase [Mycobacterium hubeiense]|uniref:GNAT family N-acetyltransferase n=1 Tax=Mycobacterium hubeiense TaxID=1867256 RepID=UPI001E428CA1|nr:GNAT family N-acetyltransferase [Mycobacterium sp. QGD 101]